MFRLYFFFIIMIKLSKLFNTIQIIYAMLTLFTFNIGYPSVNLTGINFEVKMVLY